jgi:predicted membrane metal-binding protein
MNFRLIVFVALVLLIFAPKRRLFSKPTYELPFKLNPLAKAYFLGDKTQLSTKEKKLHQALNLQHLMTPSGLHLSSLLVLFSFLSKRPSFTFFILSLLSFCVFPLSGLLSLKRMIIFGLLKVNPLKKISNTICFWLTFTISYLLGMYFQSPLSFTLSFVFLGALLCSGFRL